MSCPVKCVDQESRPERWTFCIRLQSHLYQEHNRIFLPEHKTYDHHCLALWCHPSASLQLWREQGLAVRHWFQGRQAKHLDFRAEVQKLVGSMHYQSSM